jgi:hypothetical protein
MKNWKNFGMQQDVTGTNDPILDWDWRGRYPGPMELFDRSRNGLRRRSHALKLLHQHFGNDSWIQETVIPYRDRLDNSLLLLEDAVTSGLEKAVLLNNLDQYFFKPDFESPADCLWSFRFELKNLLKSEGIDWQFD